MSAAIWRRLKVAWLVGLLSMPVTALAQPVAPSSDDQQAADQDVGDPPARVGRLGYVQGQVSQFGEGNDDWVAAQLNFPVTSDTAFATGADGRAEFELGGALARIDVGTELDVVTLDEANADLRLPQGTLAIDLPSPPPDLTPPSTVVTTPRGDVAVAAPGHYVIGAGTESEPTVVTVVDGAAQITDATGATFDVAAGQSGVLTGDTNHPGFGIEQPRLGPFAAWVRQRDAALAAAAPPPDVPPQMTGVAELGSYGNWEAEGDYGPVWFPRDIAAGWEPYREGHWAHIRPWGWTWIDDAPWGFAPFHYGRWVRIHDRWAWAPGVAPAGEGYALPVYAPALVVFATLGAAGPDVAWYPLGWNEPYIPPYRVSRGYLDYVNRRVVEQPRLAQVTNIYGNLYGRGTRVDPYRELHVGAYRDRAIAVPRAAFTGARPVAHVAVKPDLKKLQPAVQPAGVRPPPPRARAKLATAEPPKPKVLPAAKRAPIPQKLMAPKPSAHPAAATVRPPAPGKPGSAPAAKPVTVAPTKPETKPGAPPSARPAVVHPEAKPQPLPPAARPPAAPPETKPSAKPETRPAPTPAVVRPEPRPEQKPEARPQPRPEPKPAVQRPPAQPESRPPPKPEARPAPAPRPTAAPPPRPPQPQPAHPAPPPKPAPTSDKNQENRPH